MADDIKLILEEFVIKMKECLGSDIQSIVLYGSYARGDFNAQSDLDIMILVHSSDSDIKKLLPCPNSGKVCGLDKLIIINLLG